MVQYPDVYDLRTIALAFRPAMNADTAGPLVDSIQKAKRCDFGAVVRFALSAAVELKWSTGQVEGQINRLKMKRQMYGRAGIKLLRARILRYAPAQTAEEPNFTRR